MTRWIYVTQCKEERKEQGILTESEVKMGLFWYLLNEPTAVKASGGAQGRSQAGYQTVP